MPADQLPDTLLKRDCLDSLTRVSRKLRTVFNARVTAHGLTYARARTLLRLSEGANLTQKALAEKLELEQATMGRLLDTMEELGLIRRAFDPHDRRAKRIVLTKHGAAQAELVEQIGAEVREELFAGITGQEMRDALVLLDAIERNTVEMS